MTERKTDQIRWDILRKADFAYHKALLDGKSIKEACAAYRKVYDEMISEV